MRHLIDFGHFWRNFILGDYWMMGIAVIISFFIAVQMAHVGVNGWIVLPVVIALSLTLSVLWALKARHVKPDWKMVTLLVSVIVIMGIGFFRGFRNLILSPTKAPIAPIISTDPNGI